jgi:hypothetical protein
MLDALNRLPWRPWRFAVESAAYGLPPRRPRNFDSAAASLAWSQAPSTSAIAAERDRR